VTVMESLVIFTAVDGLVTAADGAASVDAAKHVVELLRTFAVPVVFITDRQPAEMMRLQRELGVRHPFIAGSGAELYVPKGYFPDVLDTEPDEESDWQVLHLHARGGDVGDAVRLLMALYRFGDDPVLFVGLGENWKHRALLRAVDVPVIVRNDAVDQVRLLRSIPDAYLTMAAGAAGWTEAILGAAVE
jgi:predicted mannosyl-3-phosphoglycerate phosphatase (HAD superfamily)